jgi:hypothetical protein
MARNNMRQSMHNTVFERLLVFGKVFGWLLRHLEEIFLDAQ